MSCTDFCTAAKCAELEARIASLESKYETLLDAFLTHKDGTVYDVHGFNPNIIVDVTEYEGTYYLSVILDTYYGDSTTFTVTPKPPEVEFFTVKTTTVGEWEFILTIDGVETRAILPIEFPPLELYFEQYYYGNEIELYLYSNSEIYADTYAEIYLELNELTIEQEPEDPHVVSNLELILTYANDILEITVADGESSATGTVFIDAKIINNYGGGGGSSVSCEQKIEECCELLASLINQVETTLIDSKVEILDKLVSVEDWVTIEIEGEAPTEFVCSDSENELPTSTALNYTEKGLAGIHELLKITNNNLFSIFTAACQVQPEIAAPSWWQVRLGGNVPQLVCTFRRIGTRTYHSLTIPHPLNVNPPIEPLLNQYTKGNFQGMIVLRDNSKFIVNANSVTEAERVCNEAAQLIDPSYLPTPLKIWLTERKGEVVSTDLMKPTSIFYYANGQQNTKPNWRVGLTKLHAD